MYCSTANCTISKLCYRLTKIMFKTIRPKIEKKVIKSSLLLALMSRNSKITCRGLK